MARQTIAIVDVLRNRFDRLIADNPEAAIAFLLDQPNDSGGNGSAEVETDDVRFHVADRRRTDARNVLPVRATRPVQDVQRPARAKRQRTATVAYQAKRNRAGNVTGEPKRPADLPAWKFLLRHRKPVTIIDLEQATGLSNSVLRNNLYRMQREGIIDTVKLDRE